MASELIIKIGAETKAFEDALDNAKKEIEGFEKAAQTAAKISGIAFASLTGIITGSALAFRESELATNKLNASLKAQGILSEELVDAYAKQADELQNLTGVSDDAITEGQALLQSFLGQTKISKELTQAVLDLSAAQGIDLQSAFKLVGKAATSDTEILKRYGIEIDASASKNEKLSQIISQVNQKFEGQAEAASQGLGRLKVLKEVVGNLFEALGEQFAPAIVLVTDKLITLVNVVKDNQPLVKFTAGIIAFSAALTGLVTIVSGAGVAFAAMAPIVTALGVSFGAVLAPMLAVASAVGVVTAAILSSHKAIDVKGKSSADLKKRLEELRAEEDKLNSAKPSLFYDGAKEAQKTVALKRVKTEMQVLQDEIKKLDIEEEKARVNQAKRRQVEQTEINRGIASKRAEGELVELINKNSSDKILQLKKSEIDILKKLEDDKNKSLKSQLQESLRIVRNELENAFTIEETARNDFQLRVLKNTKEFQALSIEDQKDFLKAYSNDLQKNLETEKTLRDKSVKSAIESQIELQNNLLKNRGKFKSLFEQIETVVNFKAVLEFAQLGLGALGELLKGPETALKNQEEAQAKEQELIRTRGEAIKTEFEAQRDILEQRKQSGEITKETFEAEIKAIEKKKDASLTALDNEIKAIKDAAKQKDEERKKELSAQTASLTLISSAVGKIADIYLPGVGAVVQQIVDIAGKGPEAIQSALNSIISAIPVVFQTILTSIDNVLISIAQLLGPLLIGIFQSLGPFLGEVLGSLGTIVSDIVIGILDAVFVFIENIDSILMKIIDGLIASIEKLVEKIPMILERLVDLSPRIIDKLISVMPQLSEALARALYVIIPPLVVEVAKQMGVVFINSLIEGFEKIINGFVRFVNHLPGVEIGSVSLPRVAAETGGIIGGGYAGMDSVPAMLAPGELVVPAEFAPSMLELLRQNIEDRRTRGGMASPSMNQTKVIIGFEGSAASQFLTAKQIEDRALGISREST